MWLTGEMSDLIKFQFYFKTFIGRDDPPMPHITLNFMYVVMSRPRLQRQARDKNG